MKKVLITGASGFIGGWLVDEALKRGYEVYAGVRAGSSLKRLNDSRIQLVTLNYEDVDALSVQLSNLAPLDGVIHNAGITKTVKVSDFYRINADYTSNLAKALLSSDCRTAKFLLMSSLSVYGPVREADGGMISENDTPHPNSHYGKSKLLAEQRLRALPTLEHIIMQPTGVYGPGEKDYRIQIDSIRRGLDLHVGLKPQQLSFIYVKDLVRAVFEALQSPLTGVSIIVADGKTYSADDFCMLVKSLFNEQQQTLKVKPRGLGALWRLAADFNRQHTLKVKLPLLLCRYVCLALTLLGRLRGKPLTLNNDKYKILKQRNWACNTDRLKQLLHFHPQFDLEKGLKDLLLEEL
jgi:nucleoside-diphosphate-sugar epimerase